MLHDITIGAAVQVVLPQLVTLPPRSERIASASLQMARRIRLQEIRTAHRTPPCDVWLLETEDIALLGAAVVLAAWLPWPYLAS